MVNTKGQGQRIKGQHEVKTSLEVGERKTLAIKEDFMDERSPPPWGSISTSTAKGQGQSQRSTRGQEADDGMTFLEDPKCRHARWCAAFNRGLFLRSRSPRGPRGWGRGRWWGEWRRRGSTFRWCGTFFSSSFHFLENVTALLLSMACVNDADRPREMEKVDRDKKVIHQAQWNLFYVSFFFVFK